MLSRYSSPANHLFSLEAALAVAGRDFTGIELARSLESQCGDHLRAQFDRWDALPPTVRHFLEAAAASPQDEATRLIFADWLEERGDPRADVIRLRERVRELEAKERFVEARERLINDVCRQYGVPPRLLESPALSPQVAQRLADSQQHVDRV